MLVKCRCLFAVVWAGEVRKQLCSREKKRANVSPSNAVKCSNARRVCLAANPTAATNTPFQTCG